MTNRKQETLTFMAGEAFGSGFHLSTQLALKALDSLKDRPFSRILDMGCGSGILSLASAHWWPDARITAADIEERAVETTRINAKEAGFTGHIAAIRSDGFSEIKGDYDLIISNIIAEQLMRMAPDMAKHLAPGGKLVLSGILLWLLPQVMEFYQAAGFKIEKTFAQGEWRAIVLSRV